MLVVSIQLGKVEGSETGIEMKRDISLFRQRQSRFAPGQGFDGDKAYVRAENVQTPHKSTRSTYLPYTRLYLSTYHYKSCPVTRIMISRVRSHPLHRLLKCDRLIAMLQIALIKRHH